MIIKFTNRYVKIVNLKRIIQSFYFTDHSITFTENIFFLISKKYVREYSNKI